MTTARHGPPTGIAAELPAPDRKTVIAYSFGWVAAAVKGRALSTFLVIFYNQVVGLPPSTVGTIISISLLIDAITNPLVGQFSDGLRSRWGRRHPFMIASALPFAVTFYFLWNPPEGLTAPQLLTWLTVFLFAVRFFDTLFELPHQALAPEFTRDYDGRTRLVAWRQAFGIVGGLGAQILAYQVFLRTNADGSGGVLARDGYMAFAIFGSVVILISVLISSFGTLNYARQIATQPKKKTKSTLTAMFREIGESLNNRAFIVLTVVLMLVSISWGAKESLEIYINLYFWQLGQGQMALLATISVVGGCVGVILSPHISTKIGKKWGLILVFIVMVIVHVAPIILRLAGLAPANGTTELLGLIYGQTLINAVLEAATTVLGMAIFADIVEDVEVKTGRRSEGLLMSASSLMRKMVSGGGILISSSILSLAAFPIGVDAASIPAEALQSLGYAYVPTIVILNGVSIFLLFFFNIDRNRHEDNLRILRDIADSSAIAPGPSQLVEPAISLQTQTPARQ